MGPIKRAEMGEVWPGVEPGRGPGDLGSATLAPTDPVVVRSYQTFCLTYTVGLFGLDDTGGIMVGLRWVSDGGALQIDDPAAMNYVTARSSTGVPLELFVEPYGFRPWTLPIRITVKGGYLCAGDTIQITFGDTTGGGPGMRMQTIAEPALEFRVSVDACATGNFSVIDQRLSVPVVAGPPAVWRVVGPGLRRPGERFAIGIRVEDAWGNPARADWSGLRLAADTIQGLPDVPPAGTPAARIDRLTAPEGVHHVHLLDSAGQVIATSNPIVVRAGDDAGYWGDLHGQSGETVGIGTIDEYMTFARDIAFLDVSGHQGNDFQIKNAFWDRINQVTADLDVPGRFTVFPGYEWSGNTPVGGDHNVFFRHEGCAIRRSSHAMLEDRGDLDSDAFTLDGLFDALQGEDCVLWSHVGGRPADVGYAHDPRLKTAVEVHSNWGTFEWILTDSLALGHRVGVVANSDGHKGRPGAGPPGATEFGAYGGLTCFLAPELSRDAIFRAMRRRHHYGTSGSRIHLDVTARFEGAAELYPEDPAWSAHPPRPATQARMGDIVRTQALSYIEIAVEAPAGIERVDLLDAAETLTTWRPFSAEDLGGRVRVYWQGAEYRGRGRNTFWQGTLALQGAQITGMEPINQWNPERPLTQEGPDRVAFEAVTSGSYAGVELMLDCPGHLTVETNLVTGTVDIAQLGLEDHRLDAGGLDRAIVIRRLPDGQTPQSWRVSAPIAPEPGRQRALWVRITTTDGHQAWSSPIYLLAQ
ncbi:MAG: DUF3604 domain-containing protein [Pseudomonadota bacterium]